MADMTPLGDISDDAPAGENLELDASFGALERASRGKDEQQFGDTIIPAEPPEWKEVDAIGIELLARTLDLRVMTHLAIARLHLSGLPGFGEMLGQIRYQLENRWQSVHPQLDPEDDNDPMLRANALVRLQDPRAVLRTMRDLPLATTPMTGPVSWRDIAIFRGSIDPVEGQAKPTEALIRGAFTNSNPDRMQATRAAVEQALKDVDAIPAAFDTNAGSGSGPDLTNLRKMLADIQKELRTFEPTTETPEAMADMAGAPATTEAASAGGPMLMAAAPRGGVSIRSITAVGSRDDALYLLDLISAYFRDKEPSNPAPMLIDRARRLATMDFMDILRDLAPDGVNQAQTIAGVPPE